MDLSLPLLWSMSKGRWVAQYPENPSSLPYSAPAPLPPQTTTLTAVSDRSQPSLKLSEQHSSNHLIQTSRGCCRNADSDGAGLEWDLRGYISNKLLNKAAAAAGLGTTLGVVRFYTVVLKGQSALPTCTMTASHNQSAPSYLHLPFLPYLFSIGF